MNQKKKNPITYWLSVIVIGLALGLGLQFVRAWTEPTAAPPNGNVGAPINTSANSQTKSGGIYSSSFFSAPWVYAQVSTPKICLTGSCRTTWTPYAYSCYQDAPNRWNSGNGCASGYYVQSVYALYSNVYMTSLAITCCTYW